MSNALLIRVNQRCGQAPDR